MNDLNITAPEGYEIDLENSDLEQGVIKFKEKNSGLVMSWGDLGFTSGYFVDTDSDVQYSDEIDTEMEYYRNTWATKEQAEASIAMAMLSQLMKQANGDWKPDWADEHETKYIIFRQGNTLMRQFYYTRSHFLAFKSQEIRDEFLELHRDLIEKAKPLL